MADFYILTSVANAGRSGNERQVEKKRENFAGLLTEFSKNL